MQKMILLSLFMSVLTVNALGLSSSQKWRDYFSYKSCFDVVETDQWVVGATTLGLILYDKNTQSLSVLNKINGLSDSGISAIGYYPDRQMVVVGYENGNIDLVEPAKISNIPDLKIDNMKGSKKINHVLSTDNKLFCSTDFGLLLIDPEEKEISATYYIGEDASSLEVYGTAADNDYLYAATSSGVLRAPRNSNQLAYFQTWEHISAQSPYCDIEVSQAGVLAVRGLKGESVSLEKWDEGSWQSVQNFNSFWSLDATSQGPVVVTASKLFLYNSALQTTDTITTIQVRDGNIQPDYRKSLLATDGTLWVANNQGGLFFEQATNMWQQMLPPGPSSNMVFNVNTAGESLWILPGGFASALNNAAVPANISVLSEGSWHYFNRSNTSEFSAARDLINMVADPRNSDKMMVASWGSGIYEFDALTLQQHYMQDNSGLQNIDWAGSQYTRIWGLDYDKDNNLWITNSSVNNGVVVLTAEGQWYQYSYASLSTPNAIGQILAGPEGYKWLIVYRSDAQGLFVFDENKTIDNQSDDRYRGAIPPSRENDARNAGQMLLWDENGEEITQDLYCIAFDQNGYLWIGTASGIVVQYNPSSVFRDDMPAFSKIKVPRDDDSGLADYLLENERITTIAIDGANRKYIGTQNSGVFLVSEDGTKTISTFNTSNSPLPSNLINCIHIDQASGEVFIATDMGLVSVKGDAVQGGQEFKNVHAYPNPVRNDYQGPITITGLMERTNVKITDTAGNLVYETTSLGGNALWNGKNMWGKKVKAGIYIVLLSSPDGLSTSFTKIAIIR